MKIRAIVVFLLAIYSAPSWAASSAAIIQNPIFTGFPGQCLYTYDCGTSTKHSTCADSLCSSSNANPMTLDARGEALVYGNQCFKLALYEADADGVCNSTPSTALIWTQEINPVLTPLVSTVADLRSHPGSTSFLFSQPAGYYTAGDGGGGPVRNWVYGAAPGTYIDNGSSIIVPSGGDGSAAWTWGDIAKSRIEWFGAVSTTTDGTTAIDKANAWLLGATAAHPRDLVIDLPVSYQGTTKHAAIYAAGVSGITIEFESTGVLKMENLARGAATMPGIFIAGPATDITTVNLNVQWPIASNTRLHHGVVFKGYPSTNDCLKNVKMLGTSYIKNAPNFSVLMAGVSHYRVDKIIDAGSLGDGFHSNASQHGNIGSVTSYNPGDDGVAFVNYYGVTNFSGGYPTWNIYENEWDLPALGDWSNYDCQIGVTNTFNGSASAFKITAGKEVTSGPVTSQGCGQAVNLDSVAPGYASTSHLASQGVRVGNINSRGDSAALSVQCLGAKAGIARMWTDADIKVGDLDIQEPITVNQALVINMRGVEIGSVSGTSGAGINPTWVNIQGSEDIKVGDILTTVADGGGTTLAVQGSAIGNPCKHIKIGEISTDSRALLVQFNAAAVNSEDLEIGPINSINCITTPIVVQGVTGLRTGNIYIENWNSTDSAAGADIAGILLTKCKDVTIPGFTGRTLATNYQSIYLGLNDRPGQQDNISISNINITAPGSGHKVTIQNGANAPTNYKISGRYYSTGDMAWSQISYNTFSGL